MYASSNPTLYTTGRIHYSAFYSSQPSNSSLTHVPCTPSGLTSYFRLHTVRCLHVTCLVCHQTDHWPWCILPIAAILASNSLYYPAMIKGHPFRDSTSITGHIYRHRCSHLFQLAHCPSPNTWAATLLWTHFGLDGHYTCRCLTRDQLTSLTLTTPVYSYAYTHALTIDWTWDIRQLLERNGLLCHQALLFPSAPYYGLGNIFAADDWISYAQL